ncbi:MAG: NAD(P)/FAD-dependent oxidoreductase [Planctomycetaceae bacterium]|nr:NAD(P)/FAD-dependent oxidoreductase [Planctomycetaceae bacterium]
MVTKSDPYDVAVIGGGPAGTTIATLLQQQGHRCVVMEGASFPRYHIGESLIPHTYGTLHRLGLLPKLQSSSFPVKHSVRFVPPSGKRTEPFYFSEVVDGDRAQTWQVDRADFDMICMDNAMECGVEVRTPCRVRKVLFDGEQATGLRVEENGGSTQDLEARVVVDASGRSTVIGKQLRLKTDVPGIDKSSIWTYYQGGHRGEGIDAGETTIFMLPDRGWFWYIPQPNDQVSVGLVAEPDYLFREGKEYDTAWTREVSACQPLSEWLANAEQVSDIRGYRKLAYINRKVVGNGWVMVGDSAGFLDPVYSSGLFLALSSSEMAADCLHDALVANDASPVMLGKFVSPLWEGVEVIHRLIRAFYDSEFSFHDFVERFPEQRRALIDCLMGDVVGKDMSTFLESLAKMTPPPPALHDLSELAC